jgi:hypothetical protein
MLQIEQQVNKILASWNYSRWEYRVRYEGSGLQQKQLENWDELSLYERWAFYLKEDFLRVGAYVYRNGQNHWYPRKLAFNYGYYGKVQTVKLANETKVELLNPQTLRSAKELFRYFLQNAHDKVETTEPNKELRPEKLAKQFGRLLRNNTLRTDLQAVYTFNQYMRYLGIGDDYQMRFGEAGDLTIGKHQWDRRWITSRNKTFSGRKPAWVWEEAFRIEREKNNEPVYLKVLKNGQTREAVKESTLERHSEEKDPFLLEKKLFQLFRKEAVAKATPFQQEERISRLQGEGLSATSSLGEEQMEIQATTPGAMNDYSYDDFPEEMMGVVMVYEDDPSLGSSYLDNIARTILEEQKVYAFVDCFQIEDLEEKLLTEDQQNPLESFKLRFYDLVFIDRHLENSVELSAEAEQALLSWIANGGEVRLGPTVSEDDSQTITKDDLINGELMKELTANKLPNPEFYFKDSIHDLLTNVTLWERGSMDDIQNNDAYFASEPATFTLADGFYPSCGHIKVRDYYFYENGNLVEYNETADYRAEFSYSLYVPEDYHRGFYSILAKKMNQLPFESLTLELREYESNFTIEAIPLVGLDEPQNPDNWKRFSGNFGEIIHNYEGSYVDVVLVMEGQEGEYVRKDIKNYGGLHEFEDVYSEWLLDGFYAGFLGGKNQVPVMLYHDTEAIGEKLPDKTWNYQATEGEQVYSSPYMEISQTALLRDSLLRELQYEGVNTVVVDTEQVKDFIETNPERGGILLLTHPLTDELMNGTAINEDLAADGQLNEQDHSPAVFWLKNGGIIIDCLREPLTYWIDTSNPSEYQLKRLEEADQKIFEADIYQSSFAMGENETIPSTALFSETFDDLKHDFVQLKTILEHFQESSMSDWETPQPYPNYHQELDEPFNYGETAEPFWDTYYDDTGDLYEGLGELPPYDHEWEFAHTEDNTTWQWETYGSYNDGKRENGFMYRGGPSFDLSGYEYNKSDSSDAILHHYNSTHFFIETRIKYLNQTNYYDFIVFSVTLSNWGTGQQKFAIMEFTPQEEQLKCGVNQYPGSPDGYWFSQTPSTFVMEQDTFYTLRIEVSYDAIRYGVSTDNGQTFTYYRESTEDSTYFDHQENNNVYLVTEDDFGGDDYVWFCLDYLKTGVYRNEGGYWDDWDNSPWATTGDQQVLTFVNCGEGIENKQAYFYYNITSPDTWTGYNNLSYSLEDSFDEQFSLNLDFFDKSYPTGAFAFRVEFFDETDSLLASTVLTRGSLQSKLFFEEETITNTQTITHEFLEPYHLSFTRDALWRPVLTISNSDGVITSLNGSYRQLQMGALKTVRFSFRAKGSATQEIAIDNVLIETYDYPEGYYEVNDENSPSALLLSQETTLTSKNGFISTDLSELTSEYILRLTERTTEGSLFIGFKYNESENSPKIGLEYNAETDQFFFVARGFAGEEEQVEIPSIDPREWNRFYFDYYYDSDYERPFIYWWINDNIITNFKWYNPTGYCSIEDLTHEPNSLWKFTIESKGLVTELASLRAGFESRTDGPMEIAFTEEDRSRNYASEIDDPNYYTVDYSIIEALNTWQHGGVFSINSYKIAGEEVVPSWSEPYQMNEEGQGYLYDPHLIVDTEGIVWFYHEQVNDYDYKSLWYSSSNTEPPTQDYLIYSINADFEGLFTDYLPTTNEKIQLFLNKEYKRFYLFIDNDGADFLRFEQSINAVDGTKGFNENYHVAAVMDNRLAYLEVVDENFLEVSTFDNYFDAENYSIVDVQLEADCDGLLHFVVLLHHYNDSADSGQLYYTTYSKVSSQWSDLQLLTTSYVTKGNYSLSASEEGLHLVWRENGTGNIIYDTNSLTGAFGWEELVAQTTTTKAVYRPKLLVDQHGFVHIGYLTLYQNGTTSLYSRSLTETNWQEPEVIAAAVSSVEEFAMTLDSDGALYYGWMEPAAGGMSDKYYRKRASLVQRGEMKDNRILYQPLDLDCSLLPQDDGEGSSTAEWWDADWSYRRMITVDNPMEESLADFQVAVELASSFNYDVMKANGEDIRFVDTSMHELSYYIASWEPDGTTNIWVTLPEIAASGTTIAMYYGNEAATGASDGVSTFLFFEDFEDGSLNGWSTDGASLSSTIALGEYAAVVKDNDNGADKEASIWGTVAETEQVVIEVDHYLNNWIDDGDIYMEGDFLAVNARTASGAADWEIAYTIAWDDSNTLLDYRTILHGDLTNSAEKRVMLGDFSNEYNVDPLATQQWYHYVLPVGTDSNSLTVSSGGYLELELAVSGRDTSGNDKQDYFDNIFVRKYAESEPTTTLGKEETITDYNATEPITAVTHPLLHLDAYLEDYPLLVGIEGFDYNGIYRKMAFELGAEAYREPYGDSNGYYHCTLPFATDATFNTTTLEQNAWNAITIDLEYFLAEYIELTGGFKEVTGLKLVFHGYTLIDNLWIGQSGPVQVDSVGWSSTVIDDFSSDNPASVAVLEALKIATGRNYAIFGCTDNVRKLTMNEAFQSNTYPENEDWTEGENLNPAITLTHSDSDELFEQVVMTAEESHTGQTAVAWRSRLGSNSLDFTFTEPDFDYDGLRFWWKTVDDPWYLNNDFSNGDIYTGMNGEQWQWRDNGYDITGYEPFNGTEGIAKITPENNGTGYHYLYDYTSTDEDYLAGAKTYAVSYRCRFDHLDLTNGFLAIGLESYNYPVFFAYALDGSTTKSFIAIDKGSAAVPHRLMSSWTWKREVSTDDWNASFLSDWHTYTIETNYSSEQEERFIRFYVDDVYVGEITTSQLNFVTNLKRVFLGGYEDGFTGTYVDWVQSRSTINPAKIPFTDGTPSLTFGDPDNPAEQYTADLTLPTNSNHSWEQVELSFDQLGLPLSFDFSQLLRLRLTLSWTHSWYYGSVNLLLDGLEFYHNLSRRYWNYPTSGDQAFVTLTDDDQCQIGSLEEIMHDQNRTVIDTGNYYDGDWFTTSSGLDYQLLNSPTGERLQGKGYFDFWKESDNNGASIKFGHSLPDDFQKYYHYSTQVTYLDQVENYTAFGLSSIVDSYGSTHVFSIQYSPLEEQLRMGTSTSYGSMWDFDEGFTAVNFTWDAGEYHTLDFFVSSQSASSRWFAFGFDGEIYRNESIDVSLWDYSQQPTIDHCFLSVKNAFGYQNARLRVDQLTFTTFDFNQLGGFLSSKYSFTLPALEVPMQVLGSRHGDFLLGFNATETGAFIGFRYTNSTLFYFIDSSFSPESNHTAEVTTAYQLVNTNWYQIVITHGEVRFYLNGLLCGQVDATINTTSFSFFASTVELYTNTSVLLLESISITAQQSIQALQYDSGIEYTYYEDFTTGEHLFEDTSNNPRFTIERPTEGEFAMTTHTTYDGGGSSSGWQIQWLQYELPDSISGTFAFTIDYGYLFSNNDKGMFYNFIYLLDTEEDIVAMGGQYSAWGGGTNKDYLRAFSNGASSYQIKTYSGAPEECFEDGERFNLQLRIIRDENNHLSFKIIKDGSIIRSWESSKTNSRTIKTIKVLYKGYFDNYNDYSMDYWIDRFTFTAEEPPVMFDTELLLQENPLFADPVAFEVGSHGGWFASVKATSLKAESLAKASEIVSVVPMITEVVSYLVSKTEPAYHLYWSHAVPQNTVKLSAMSDATEQQLNNPHLLHSLEAQLLAAPHTQNYWQLSPYHPTLSPTYLQYESLGGTSFSDFSVPGQLPNWLVAPYEDIGVSSSYPVEYLVTDFTEGSAVPYGSFFHEEFTNRSSGSSHWEAFDLGPTDALEGISSQYLAPWDNWYLRVAEQNLITNPWLFSEDGDELPDGYFPFPRNATWKTYWTMRDYFEQCWFMNSTLPGPFDMQVLDSGENTTGSPFWFTTSEGWNWTTVRTPDGNRSADFSTFEFWGDAESTYYGIRDTDHTSLDDEDYYSFSTFVMPVDNQSLYEGWGMAVRVGVGRYAKITYNPASQLLRLGIDDDKEQADAPFCHTMSTVEMNWTKYEGYYLTVEVNHQTGDVWFYRDDELLRHTSEDNSYVTFAAGDSVHIGLNNPHNATGAALSVSDVAAGGWMFPRLGTSFAVAELSSYQSLWLEFDYYTETADTLTVQLFTSDGNYNTSTVPPSWMDFTGNSTLVWEDQTVITGEQPSTLGFYHYQKDLVTDLSQNGRYYLVVTFNNSQNGSMECWVDNFAVTPNSKQGSALGTNTGYGIRSTKTFEFDYTKRLVSDYSQIVLEGMSTTDLPSGEAKYVFSVELYDHTNERTITLYYTWTADDRLYLESQPYALEENSTAIVYHVPMYSFLDASVDQMVDLHFTLQQLKGWGVEIDQKNVSYTGRMELLLDDGASSLFLDSIAFRGHSQWQTVEQATVNPVEAFDWKHDLLAVAATNIWALHSMNLRLWVTGSDDYSVFLNEQVVGTHSAYETTDQQAFNITLNAGLNKIYLRVGHETTDPSVSLQLKQEDDTPLSEALEEQLILMNSYNQEAFSSFSSGMTLSLGLGGITLDGIDYNAMYGAGGASRTTILELLENLLTQKFESYNLEYTSVISKAVGLTESSAQLGFEYNNANMLTKTGSYLDFLGYYYDNSTRSAVYQTFDQVVRISTLEGEAEQLSENERNDLYDALVSLFAAMGMSGSEDGLNGDDESFPVNNGLVKGYLNPDGYLTPADNLPIESFCFHAETTESTGGTYTLDKNYYYLNTQQIENGTVRIVVSQLIYHLTEQGGSESLYSVPYSVIYIHHFDNVWLYDDLYFKGTTFLESSFQNGAYTLLELFNGLLDFIEEIIRYVDSGGGERNYWAYNQFTTIMDKFKTNWLNNDELDPFASSAASAASLAADHMVITDTIELMATMTQLEYEYGLLEENDNYGNELEEESVDSISASYNYGYGYCVYGQYQEPKIGLVSSYNKNYPGAITAGGSPWITKATTDDHHYDFEGTILEEVNRTALEEELYKKYFQKKVRQLLIYFGIGTSLLVSALTVNNMKDRKTTETGTKPKKAPYVPDSKNYAIIDLQTPYENKENPPLFINRFKTIPENQEIERIFPANRPAYLNSIFTQSELASFAFWTLYSYMSPSNTPGKYAAGRKQIQTQKDFNNLMKKHFVSVDELTSVEGDGIHGAAHGVENLVTMDTISTGLAVDSLGQIKCMRGAFDAVSRQLHNSMLSLGIFYRTTQFYGIYHKDTFNGHSKGLFVGKRNRILIHPEILEKFWQSVIRTNLSGRYGALYEEFGSESEFTADGEMKVDDPKYIRRYLENKRTNIQLDDTQSFTITTSEGDFKIKRVTYQAYKGQYPYSYMTQTEAEYFRKVNSPLFVIDAPGMHFDGRPYITLENDFGTNWFYEIEDTKVSTIEKMLRNDPSILDLYDLEKLEEITTTGKSRAVPAGEIASDIISKDDSEHPLMDTLKNRGYIFYIIKDQKTESYRVIVTRGLITKTPLDNADSYGVLTPTNFNKEMTGQQSLSTSQVTTELDCSNWNNQMNGRVLVTKLANPEDLKEDAIYDLRLDINHIQSYTGMLYEMKAISTAASKIKRDLMRKAQNLADNNKNFEKQFLAEYKYLSSYSITDDVTHVPSVNPILKEVLYYWFFINFDKIKQFPEWSSFLEECGLYSKEILSYKDYTKYLIPAIGQGLYCSVNSGSVPDIKWDQIKLLLGLTPKGQAPRLSKNKNPLTLYLTKTNGQDSKQLTLDQFLGEGSISYSSEILNIPELVFENIFQVVKIVMNNAKELWENDIEDENSLRSVAKFLISGFYCLFTKLDLSEAFSGMTFVNIIDYYGRTGKAILEMYGIYQVIFGRDLKWEDGKWVYNPVILTGKILMNLRNLLSQKITQFLTKKDYEEKFTEKTWLQDFSIPYIKRIKNGRLISDYLHCNLELLSGMMDTITKVFMIIGLCQGDKELIANYCERVGIPNLFDILGLETLYKRLFYGGGIIRKSGFNNKYSLVKWKEQTDSPDTFVGVPPCTVPLDLYVNDNSLEGYLYSIIFNAITSNPITSYDEQGNAIEISILEFLLAITVFAERDGDRVIFYKWVSNGDKVERVEITTSSDLEKHFDPVKCPEGFPYMEENNQMRTIINLIVAQKNGDIIEKNIKNENLDYFIKLFETPGFNPTDDAKNKITVINNDGESKEFTSREYINEFLKIKYYLRMDTRPAVDVDTRFIEAFNVLRHGITGTHKIEDFSETFNAHIIQLKAKQATAEKVQQSIEDTGRFPIYQESTSLKVFNEFLMTLNDVGISDQRKANDFYVFFKMLQQRQETIRLYKELLKVKYNSKTKKYSVSKKCLGVLNQLITHGLIPTITDNILQSVKNLQIFNKDLNTLRGEKPTFDIEDAKLAHKQMQTDTPLIADMANKNWQYKKDEDGSLLLDKNGKKVLDELCAQVTYNKFFNSILLLNIMKFGIGFTEAATAGLGQAHQLPIIQYWFWQGFYRLVLYNMKTLTQSYNGTIYERAQNAPYFWSGVNTYEAFILDYIEVKGDVTEYIGSFFSGSAFAYAAFGAPLVDVQNSTQVRLFFRDMVAYWGLNESLVYKLLNNSPKWLDRLFGIFWRVFTLSFGTLLMSLSTGAILEGVPGILASLGGVLLSEQTSIMAVGFRQSRLLCKAKVLLGIESQAFKIGGWRYSKGFMGEMWHYYSQHWKDPWLDAFTGAWK